MIVTGPEVVRFVEAGIFSPGRTFGPAVGIGFVKDGRLAAGFVFHNYEPETGVIEVSGYSNCRNWVTPTYFRAIFDYPFNRAGCRVVVARHSEKNKRVIRIWRAIGADQVALPEVRGPGEAEIVAILTREKWENSKFMRASDG